MLNIYKAADGFITRTVGIVGFVGESISASEETTPRKGKQAQSTRDSSADN